MTAFPQQPKGSWAAEEFLRKHKPIIERSIRTNFELAIVGWERIYLPLPDWWGKPSVLIQGTVLGPA